MAIVVSGDNEGPVVNIAAWFGTTAMILGVCSRFWSKYSVVRRCATDDSLIMVSMFLGCAMTATISIAVANGLGQPQSSLSAHQVSEFEKNGYATQLLYIPALYISKLSTLLYLSALSPESRFEMMNLLLEALIIFWGLGAEFAIAFQCQLPSPWAIISGKCFNTTAFWISNGVFDILTDIAIILLPLYLVWSLQMPWKRKGVVAVAFGSRVLIIPLTAWRVYTISTTSRQDETLSSYHAYLTTTIQLNFAIFMTCVSFLRPFMESMVSGGMATTVVSIDNSHGKNSLPGSFLFATRTSNTTPKSDQSFAFDNLSEVGLNETQRDLGRSGSNASGTDGSQNSTTPSDHDDIHFVRVERINNGDLGPLRPDKGTNVSRVSVPLDENQKGIVGSTNMTITRTMEWAVQEKFNRTKGKIHEP